MRGKTQLGKAATYVAIGAMLYPVLAIMLTQVHYKLTFKALSDQTLATLLLTSGPMFLLCIFTLLIANRSEGSQRKAGVVCSVVGCVLNFLFFMIAGIGY